MTLSYKNFVIYMSELRKLNNTNYEIWDLKNYFVIKQENKFNCYTVEPLYNKVLGSGL